jgi:hypothetical protein
MTSGKTVGTVGTVRTVRTVGTVGTVGKHTASGVVPDSEENTGPWQA